MKGRSNLDHDALKKAPPSAKSAKTHYLIVDPIGVPKSVKTTHPCPRLWEKS
jgi:type I restriction enzyme R subunit